MLTAEERAQLAPLDAKALQKVIAVESSSTALYREEKERRICAFIRFAVYTAVLAQRVEYVVPTHHICTITVEIAPASRRSHARAALGSSVAWPGGGDSRGVVEASEDDRW